MKNKLFTTLIILLALGLSQLNAQFAGHWSNEYDVDIPGIFKMEIESDGRVSLTGTIEYTDRNTGEGPGIISLIGTEITSTHADITVYDQRGNEMTKAILTFMGDNLQFDQLHNYLDPILPAQVTLTRRY